MSIKSCVQLAVPRVTYVRMESLRASGSSKDELDRTLQELNDLAAKLYEGKKVDKSQMNDVWYDTASALAYFHYNNFMSAWDRKQKEEASREFKASVNHLEKVVANDAHGAEKDAVDTVKKARALADRIGQASEDDVKKARDDLKSLFDKIHKNTHASK